MKTLLALPVIISLTACTAISNRIADKFKSSTELAMEQCQKIGYAVNTDAYRICVTNTANSIRNARAVQSTAPSYNPAPALNFTSPGPVQQQNRGQSCVYRSIGNRYDCSPM